MFHVTDAAAARITEMLDEIEAPDEVAIRLVAPPQLPEVVTLRLDYRQARDATFDRQGRTVLLVGKRAASRLGCCTLVIEDSPAGSELVLKAPRAA